MKEISRIEFEKAVKVIENYVLQQEINFKQSKNLLDKINCFYISENDLIKNHMSVRDINSINFNNRQEIDIKKLTIKEFSEKFTINDLCKIKSVGRKNIDNLKEVMFLSGIKWE